MGNGKLVYGATLTLAQICALVEKHVEANPEVIDKRDVQVSLMRYRIRRERASVPITDTNGPFLAAEKDDKKKAEEIVTKTPAKELREQLLSAISTCFNVKSLHVQQDELDFFDYFLDDGALKDCFNNLLGTKVTLNGACCNRDDETPFIVGHLCSGGCTRGEASGPVTMPTEEEKEKVIILLDLINEVPEFLIVSQDCDSCT